MDDLRNRGSLTCTLSYQWPLRYFNHTTSESDLLNDSAMLPRDRARRNLIWAVKTLSKSRNRAMLALLSLEVHNLDDFDTFLRPMIDCWGVGSSLVSMRLTNVDLVVLPLWDILEQCLCLESLSVENSIVSAAVNETRRNNSTPRDEWQPVDPETPRRLFRLQKLFIRSSHITEQTLFTILRHSPRLSDLSIQAPSLDGDTDTFIEAEAMNATFNLSFGTVLEPEFTVSDQLASHAQTSQRVLCNNDMSFYHRLSGLFGSQLRALHFSRTHQKLTSEQVRTILCAFPNVQRWRLVWQDLPQGRLMQDLTRFTFNRLTALEILPFADWTPRLGDTLHEFLCESPLLLHLKAGSIAYYVENMDMNGVLGRNRGRQHTATLGTNEHWSQRDEQDSESYGSPETCSPPLSLERALQQQQGLLLDDKKRPRVWACRNLKTLHLEVASRRPAHIHQGSSVGFRNRKRRFFITSAPSWRSSTRRHSHPSNGDPVQGEPEESDFSIADNSPFLSRIVYGYIARLCPNLVDLQIRGYRLNMTLRGGFCLLTRLTQLKRLAIAQYDCQFKERDILPWIVKRPTLRMRLEWRLILAGWRVFPGKRPLDRTEMEHEPSVTPRSSPIIGIREQEEERERFDDPNLIPTAQIPRDTATSKENKGEEEIDFAKLGYMADVEDEFQRIVAIRITESRETWPELESVKLVYGNSFRHKGVDLVVNKAFVRKQFRKHRPGTDFQWVFWHHQF
ncbi:hypothetical protein BGW38_003419 [Lunasporangiospora selenospora]|uniref:Uncharacterized protein n=1 Tax=Lunasporangiospora selenospora TaxID=979761 RepID=A0A9P6G5D2_9FUNG|nr:hypothetical protein BGW38_003419 [Lunasporangiospora selenospora]